LNAISNLLYAVLMRVCCTFVNLSVSQLSVCTDILQSTYEAAMLAAGCCVEAVDKVVRGELRHSMALVRYDLWLMLL